MAGYLLCVPAILKGLTMLRSPIDLNEQVDTMTDILSSLLRPWYVVSRLIQLCLPFFIGRNQ